jgi:hypothetical protein
LKIADRRGLSTCVSSCQAFKARAVFTNMAQAMDYSSINKPGD